MNESLYKQLTQAAFVLMNSLKNKAKIAELRNGLSERKNKENDLKNKIEYEKNFSYGTGCLAVTIIGIIVGIIIVINFFLGNGEYCLYVGIPMAAISFALWFLTKIFQANAQITHEERMECLSEELEKTKEENKVYEKEVNEKIKEIEKVDKECWEVGKHFLDFLPEKYRNTQAIAFLGEAVKNCRADTLKEAINLYESKIERDARWDAEMEMKREEASLQAAHMQEMERIAREMNETNKNIEADISKIKWMEYYDIMNKE